MNLGPGTITFTSPIRKHLTRPVHVFQIVQPGGNPPITLSYPTRRAAVVARDQITRGQQAYTVPTSKLFAAVAVALQVAHSTRPKVANEPDQEDEIG